MVVCKFFLQGNCRFGANCRNEHPAGQGGSSGNNGGGGGGFGGQNRFGVLSSNTGSGNATNRFGGAADASKSYTLNPADIRQDLTRGQGRPNWILSTYGAGRGTPASLFDGNEYSPEELRVRFYEFAAKGQEAQADQEATQLWAKAESDIDNVANHIDDITKYMEEAENKHPNRYDFLKTDGTKTRDEIVREAEASNSSSSGFGSSNAFGQSSSGSNPFAKPAAATFGQPSAPSAFGSSTFGKPAQTSAFGQPAFGQTGFGSSAAAFGQSSTSASAFGQSAAPSSGFGQSSTLSAFGQPATANAFGKPAFGQAAFGQSGFGQTAQPATTSAFGQPAQTTSSPFGQSSSTPAFGTSAFGQPAKPHPFGGATTTSGFGTGSTVRTMPAFGQASQPTGAFGQPQAPSAFGQSSQPTSAFGQTSQPSAGFGQSAFGQPAQPNAFGQSDFGQSAQPTTSSPFGQTTGTASAFGNAGGSTGAFSQPAPQAPSPFAQATETKSAEVSMDADAPTASNTIANPAINNTAMTQSQPSTTVTSSGITAPPSQTANNTSQTPNPLISKPPKPLHYTQALPLVPSQTNMSKRLIQYRNQRVAYLGEDPNDVPCYNRPDGKGPEKIWFPDAGATQEVVALNREEKVPDLQEANDRYTQDIREQFAHLFNEGKFKDGKIPLVPPMRQWCLYDF